MRELPAGPDAVVLDFADDPEPSAAVGRAATAIRRAIESDALRATDVIPSAHTVLVQADRGAGIDVLGVHRALRNVRDDAAQADARPDEILIPVTYDGPDLDDVARTLGLGVDEVVELHRDTRWRVQFMGFAPGFGYLVAQEDPDNLWGRLPRRDESRTAVPSGAVAVAAGYSAVYPRHSPGGWQLIGHTTIAMWDENSTPPALLEPGRTVRFVPADDTGPS
ncbi:allophanate hydrolase subunit 1 [Gordonia sp. OPL2]|uniref:5-oxoprolinase subunit B family protein n=1 Tax=Gordonia sp. OPL2 TaxID=2486274 RepID=UPI001655F347|nr:allophanate hydrolase subunit 1 [Gordonia sp. OPL2]ROZ89353.1 allophanate hydrolase subunit 1 [Gordonia sp. OPL2]